MQIQSSEKMPRAIQMLTRKARPTVLGRKAAGTILALQSIIVKRF